MASGDTQLISQTEEHWKKRWEEGSTPWHRDAVDAYLQKYIQLLTGERPTASILVTLCGKTLDLPWLCEQGYKVTGVEISEQAGKQLFEENDIPYSVSVDGDFKVFCARNQTLTFYAGDFFKLSPDLDGSFDAIWDMNALGAVNPEDRTRYVAKLRSLLKVDGTILMSAYEYNQAEHRTCPFSIPNSLVKELFQDYFDITLLENIDYTDTIFTKKFSLSWGKRLIHFLKKKN